MLNFRCGLYRNKRQEIKISSRKVIKLYLVSCGITFAASLEEIQLQFNCVVKEEAYLCARLRNELYSTSREP